MKRLKNITILLCFLSSLAFISCSAEDKTGVKDNPPEDTEIVDGETESGSSSGDSSGAGGTGSSGEGETESGSTSGGSSETETGGETDNTETTETIDAKDFPENLKGTYRDEKVASGGFSGVNHNTEVSTITELGIQKTKIEGTWLKDGVTPPTGNRRSCSIEKWKQTKKGGNPIKLEGESSGSGGGKYTVSYDYASGTLSGKYTTPDGTWSFNGKKIN